MNICLALDNLKTLDDVNNRIKELHPYIHTFKIGKELYTKYGPQTIDIIHKYNSQVFLDLKYHDIPNTVKSVSKVATELGVYMFNVHTSGGLNMCRSAYDGAKEVCDQQNTDMPKIIGVTVLTSIDDNILNNELNVNDSVDNHVFRLAKMAEKANLHGIVCSAMDIPKMKSEFRDNFMYVTPGIQFNNLNNDQKRVMTPQKAIENGSSMLVIGRAINNLESDEERINVVKNLFI